VCAALEPEDYITSTHRPHGHALAKGLTPFELLAELFGKGTGCCKGKGGSMHVGNIAKGMPPAVAIVAGGSPVATGMALALKMRRQPQVVACFFGDGATSEGAFHEGVNMGAIWNLPVIYACENNQYGASTHISKVTRMKSVAERASGYGLPCQIVDGNDVLAVYEATRQAAEECRAGRGPVLLELLTYRTTGHSRRDSCNYQPAEERRYWSERDPIRIFGEKLLAGGIAAQSELDEITTRVANQIAGDIERARQEPEPTLADLTTDVYA
jgi:pyruvate dehydrogenase E1 component alpha subunit